MDRVGRARTRSFKRSDHVPSQLAILGSNRNRGVSVSDVPQNTCEFRQRLPMPCVGAASARPDERGVGLGDLHCFRDLANFLRSEQWLNSLNVTFLRQPTRQTFRVPPRVRDGANHFTFSDDGALLRSHAFRWVLRRIGKLGIDGPRQLAVTSYCIRSFFDTYLKQTTASEPTISSSLYPEIQVVE